MALETLMIFFSASVVLAMIPGADNLFVMGQSMQYGIRSGAAVIAGLCTGLAMHTLLVTLGLASVIAASPMLFFAIKILGAGYLLYLAYHTWAASEKKIALKQGQAMNSKRLYRRGLIMVSTNPKVTLFFLAFLPQFVNPETDHATLEIVILGLIFILATVLVFGTIAVLAGSVGQKFKDNIVYQKWLNKISALFFIALALVLLADGLLP